MAYVKIENGVVVQKQPNKEKGFIKVGDDVVCGMLQDGDNFTAPVNDVDLIKKHLSRYRKHKENSGVDINGVTIQTDSVSRSNILGASQLGVSVNWKTENGFVELTSEDIQGVAVAVGLHIQKCFNAERAVIELHEDTPFTSKEDIETAFDKAYSDL